MEVYEKCILCPRKCGVNRNKGGKGFCGETSTVRLGRAALHFWEEPCISGDNGSGTVFFSGCNLKCCFCQNSELSTGETGFEVSDERLSEIFLQLMDEGAHNINLVTAEHFAPNVKIAVETARKRGLTIPVILNSNGYVSGEILEILKDVIDIYLVDFKYMDSGISAAYSKASDYTAVVKSALEKMVHLAGPPQYGNDGMLKRGVIVRHLCLPTHSEDSKNVIKYVFDSYDKDVILSIMSQYTPCTQCSSFPELSSPLSNREYDDIIDFCISIGIEDAYIQEGETALESFIPKFDGKGVVFR